MKQTLTLLATLLLFPLTALAHRCRDLIRDGAIINQSELAHYGQISTTRMTQIMWLDNLAPDIQEEILGLPRTV